MKWPPRPVRFAVPPLVAACLVAALFGCSSDSDPERPSTGPSPSPSITSPVPDPPPTPDPDPEGASSQDLIAADLASGAIDTGTSLELRAWALFGDPRLPVAYDGTGSTGHDQTLLREIAQELGSLPPDQEAELSRYLLRPTEPESPFTSAGTDTERVASAVVDTTRRCTAPRQWFAQEWSPDGSADRGFRIHACGASKATVRGDLGAAIAIGSRLWVAMTRSGADGMGLPIPDTTARQNDGNGKVDVYLVDALAECRDRDRVCAKIPGNAVAIANPDPSGCTVPGFPAYGCSGYLVLGRDRLSEPVFAADFAHEFFHVLQFAHNGQVDSWYFEASAVWAEFTYERDSAEEDDYGYYTDFQEHGRSLLTEDTERLFEYESWGWPLFQATELGAKSVFATWRGIESAITRSDVDNAIDRELPFADGFREFAVLNAQPASYIPPASTGLDRWQERAGLSDFPTNPHRVSSARSPVPLGRSTHPADINALTAQYDEYEVLDEDVRQVVVDITNLTGAAQADLDVLAQVGDGDGWRRFPAYGGKITLCRDTPAEDVSFFQVVISNHVVAREGRLPDGTKRVHGGYTIEAEDECDPREKYLVGSITWRATDADQFRTRTISGQLELVLHESGPGSWTAEREDASTYAYDVSFSDCRPDTSLSGAVETGVGHFEPEWHIANTLVSQTDLTPEADLQIFVELFDEWELTCTDPSGETYPFTATGAGLFPGCAQFAMVLGKSDRAGGYTISCDVAVPGFDTWSGHVSGELHPIERPVDDPDG